MPHYLVDTATGPVTVTADRWERRGASVVFVTTRLVMHAPREVVALRLPAASVQAVREA